MLPIKAHFGTLRGNNVEYCEFPANITLSASEQEKNVLKCVINVSRRVTVQKDKQEINTLSFLCRDG